MFVIKFKKLFLGLSALFIALSIASIAIFGLKFGIDFKGGSSLELSYPNSRPNIEEVKSALINSGFGDASVQPAGAKGIVIKSRTLSESERATVVTLASLDGSTQVESYSFYYFSSYSYYSFRCICFSKSIISSFFMEIRICSYHCFDSRHYYSDRRFCSSWSLLRC